MTEIINYIENDDLKELAIELMKTIPPYFYKVGASSTGKYHPSYALGDGGLFRHTVALCKIMHHIFEVTNYNSREKDMMYIAGMMHDTRKSGTQESYENNKYTNFDHPLQAAAVVRNFKGQKWNDDDIEMIAQCIESHMGAWNTDKRSDIVLPLPINKYQKMVHLCDYLASRKDIEIKFDECVINEKVIVDNPKEVVMPFGKYNGKLLGDIPMDYLMWLNDSGMNLREPLKSSVESIIKGV